MKPTWMERLFPSRRPEAVETQKLELNEGDYHSGPDGYSPNTSYIETQYGSGFDSDADWNAEER